MTDHLAEERPLSPVSSDDYAYTAVNARLVRSIALRGPDILDLACGDGSVTRLLVQACGESCRIFAVDRDDEALQSAIRQSFRAQPATVSYIQGQVEDIDRILRCRVDHVFMGNAIHLVEVKDALVRAVWNVLKPGGTFAFNTTFFTLGSRTGQSDLYQVFVWRLYRLAASSSYPLSVADLRKSGAISLWSPTDYREQLTKAGFCEIKHEVFSVAFTKNFVVNFVQTKDFLSQLLPTVPITAARRLARRAARDSFARNRANGLTRAYLQVSAKKRST